MSITTLMNALGDCDLKPKLKTEVVEDETFQIVTIPAENGVSKFIFDMNGKFVSHNTEYSVGYANRKAR